MNRFAKLKFMVAAAVLVVMGNAGSAFGCAMCIGSRTDSPLAKGMNWGIFSLLFVVVGMLSMVGSFFIYLARKASANSASVPMPSAQLVPATSKL